MVWRSGTSETGRVRTPVFHGATGSEVSARKASDPAATETNCLRDSFMLASEVILHCELQDARIAGAGDLPEAGVVQRGHRRRQVDVIGRVENLEPHFQPVRL